MEDFGKKIELAEVTHRTFGTGLIVSLTMQSDINKIITVEFEHGEKKFSFPSCFIDNYLELNDINLKIRFDKIYNNPEQNNSPDKKKTILEKIYSLDLEKNLAINTIFSLYNDKEVLQTIIDASGKILYHYFKTGIISNEHKKVVIFTFSWISFDNYDGNFWEFIRKDFSLLYKRVGNQQGLEKAIREVISEQEKYSDARHITNVLVHAGIPKQFLKKFYDFVFDIYKINFDFQLPGQHIEEILLESLEGLTSIFNQNNYNDDLFQLNVTQKTYVLIKSTRFALSHYKLSLIQLLKQMLEIVDAWYYDFSLESECSQILTDKFNEWATENAKPLSTIERNNTEYVSKPQYVFNPSDKTINIIFPKYVLKSVSSDEFDSIDVEIIKDNNRIVLDKNQYKIIEKIGFNIIQILPQKLDFIYANISFSVSNKEKTIISTNDSLNRKFIIFDADGRERGNYKDFSDLVYVIFPKHSKFIGPDIKILYDFSTFNIAIFIANRNVIYNCDNESICFSHMMNPGIYGKQNDNVVAYMENKIISVFNQVTNFVFESEYNSDDLILRFNNKEFQLSSLRYNQSKKGVFWNYNVTIEQDLLSSNLNNIRVYNKKTSVQQIRAEEFLIDEKLDFLILETDLELEKEIIVTSSFPGANSIDTKYDFAFNDYFLCEFRIGNNKIKYKIDPKIKRYKWDLEEPWKSINDLELNNNKTMYLTSTKNIIEISNKNHILLPSVISADDSNGFSSIETSYLSQLKQENDYVFLNIKDSLGFSSNIKIYLRQVVLKHTLERKEDDSIILKFDIKNFTLNSLEVRIIKGTIVVEKLNLYSNEIVLANVHPNATYTVEVFEKEDFFLGIQGKVIYQFSLYINDSTKLEGKSFIINEAFIFSFDKTHNLIYESIKMKPIVIKIKDKIKSLPHKYSSLNIDSNMVYRCSLFKLTLYGELKPFYHLKEIFIEVITKKSSSIINFIAEDTGGDGLLLSNKNQKFLVDSIDEDSRYTIDYLVIDTERDEYNE